MVDTQQQVSLNELRLNGGCTDGDDGFLGEHRRTLRHCPDITCEFEIRQIGKKFLTEQIPAAQVLDVFGREMKILNVLDDLLQTGGNSKSTAIGTPSEKQVEIGDAILIARGKIALTHGQFIKVTEHG